MYDFFISYSRKDRDKIENLLKAAKAMNANYFMDTKDNPIGCEYGERIDEALQNSKAVVCIWTENSDVSKNVKREIYLSDQYDLPIIPIRIGDFKAKGLNYMMANLNQCRVKNLSEDISYNILKVLIEKTPEKTISESKVEKSKLGAMGLAGVAAAALPVIGLPIGAGALIAGALIGGKDKVTELLNKYVLKDSTVAQSNDIIDSISEKI